ncbi:hypothetical protein [Chryseobacterium sp. EZn1]|uniref:hypothetical protein n=1 Tax=Chryseobacterium cupriresistens TaxID=3366770 RepID=UPI0039855B87
MKNCKELHNQKHHRGLFVFVLRTNASLKKHLPLAILSAKRIDNSFSFGFFDGVGGQLQ